MSLRIPVLLFLGSLSGLADAGIWETGNPPGVVDRSALGEVRVQGWCSGYKLTGGHGREAVVHLPRPVRLTD
ncbi:hypothetical protein, partial [Plasticicumulans sp.]|uniref:hypothetical protein n=1 Tax=Plasticicumulans sp. TaxID=2307179 RepID=UPI002B770893